MFILKKIFQKMKSLLRQFWCNKFEFGIYNSLMILLLELDKKRKNEFILQLLKKDLKKTIDKIEYQKPKKLKKIHVWTFWAQGIDKAPDMVKLNINKLRENCKKYKVITLDINTYSEYVKIPTYIEEKIKKGEISVQHFSDILRVCLLSEYGGLWFDATVFLVKQVDFVYDFEKLSVYTQRFYKEDNNDKRFIFNPSKGRWATFVLGTNEINNIVFQGLKYLFFEYNKMHKYFIDYFLFDFLIQILYDSDFKIKEELDKIPINNTNVYAVNKKHDRASLKRCCFFKMNWRTDDISSLESLTKGE